LAWLVDNSRVAFDAGTAHTEPARLANPTPFPSAAALWWGGSPAALERSQQGQLAAL